MGPIASAAARSGIATVAVIVLMSAANFALANPGDAHRLEAALRALVHPTTLICAAIGWPAFAGWLWLENRRPPPAPKGRIAGAAMAALMTLLTAAGIVLLLEGVQMARGPWFLYAGGFPWRYLLRVFEAALVAVVIVRMALPLVPRFDRMPRNS